MGLCQEKRCKKRKEITGRFRLLCVAVFMLSKGASEIH